MTSLAVIRIAVVADTSLQRHILQQFLLKQGYQVVLNSDPQHLNLDFLQACETDLWLYGTESSNDDDDDCIVLDYFLGEPRAPVLLVKALRLSVVLKTTLAGSVVYLRKLRI